MACGMLAAALLDRTECSSIDEIANRCGVSLGVVSSFVDKRCTGSRFLVHTKEERDAALIETVCNKLGVKTLDPGRELAGKIVVVTGEFYSMSQNDAVVILEAVGATVRKSVSGKTDILIEGIQDPAKVGDDGMSRKQRDCMAMKAKGKQIEVLNEQMFLDQLYD